MERTPTQRWLELSQKSWDERAEIFDQLSSANAKTGDRRVELDFVCAALGLSSGDRVLDAGCGAGYFAIALAERGYQVEGIDISPEMIVRANANASSVGVSIDFQVADLLPLSAPDGAYAAIVSRMVLRSSRRIFLPSWTK